MKNTSWDIFLTDLNSKTHSKKIKRKVNNNNKNNIEDKDQNKLVYGACKLWHIEYKL